MIDLTQPNELTKQKNMASLKKCSYDDKNKVPLLNSAFQVTNFDSVKNNYKFNGIASPAEFGFTSNDALVIYNTDTPCMVFIEFKNAPLVKYQKHKTKDYYDYFPTNKLDECKWKIKDSVFILNDILNENLEFCRNHVNYILVYGKDKNGDLEQQKSQNINYIANTFQTFGGSEFLPCGFDKYKAFFHNVRITNETEFAQAAVALQKGTYDFDKGV